MLQDSKKYSKTSFENFEGKEYMRKAVYSYKEKDMDTIIEKVKLV